MTQPHQIHTHETGGAGTPGGGRDESVKWVSGHLYAADAATLPERCVCCGDTVDLRRFRTLRGRIRYFVCHEHFISAISRMLVGGIILFFSGYQLMGRFIGGTVLGKTGMIAFGTTAIVGGILVLGAIPLHAGIRRGGWRRLYGICGAVTKDARLSTSDPV